MNRAGLRQGLAALGLALAAAAPQAAELSVYQGAGCDGVKRLQAFTDWFGRRPDRALDFLAFERWDTLLSSAAWSLKCWRATGLPMTFSIPMLPQGGHTLARGAAGEYDAHFRTLGRYLVNNGHADAVLRIGWEFNADWYPWRAAADPAAWVAYWRRIVGVLRATPGQRFRFEWSPILGVQAIRADRVYPGDDVVDLIGLDTYNESWDPAVRTPEQRWRALMEQPYGLRWHREFAAARGKPTTFPEWGTGRRPNGHGGGDDPLFIERMAQWIAAGDVAYHSYWDYPAPDFNARLSDGHQPRAGAAFLERFRGGPR